MVGRGAEGLGGLGRETEGTAGFEGCVTAGMDLDELVAGRVTAGMDLDELVEGRVTAGMDLDELVAGTCDDKEEPLCAGEGFTVAGIAAIFFSDGDCDEEITPAPGGEVLALVCGRGVALSQGRTAFLGLPSIGWKGLGAGG